MREGLGCIKYASVGAGLKFGLRNASKTYEMSELSRPLTEYTYPNYAEISTIIGYRFILTLRVRTVML